ncbi:MAG TPA: HupE/UreJ family protein [Gallionellaceae bacterium]
MRNPALRFLTIVLFIFASGAACAHPGHNASGVAAGLAHPFQGLDHLLAMVAVGLWAAQGGGKRIWLLPAAFMTLLALGAALASAWQAALPVETGIALSVLALGLLVALSRQLPVRFSVALAALFGLLHGYAHGLELPASAAPVEYALGFLLATAILHLSGIAVGVAARRQHALLAKMLGAGIAASGVWFLASA